MASKRQVVILFICLISTICNAQSGLKGGLYVGQEGQWESKAAQLESSLNEVKIAQSTDQQRLITISKVFSDQMTKLDKDVKTAKTVLNTLVEESVSTKRKLGDLEGMDTDINNLRGQLRTAHSTLSSVLATVQHTVHELDQKFRDQQQTQQAINTQHGAKLVNLSDRIDGVDDRNAAQNAKTTRLENMMQKLNQTINHPATSGSGETMSGTIRELRETVQGLMAEINSRGSTVNSQMLNLRSEIESLRREMKRNNLYPFQ